jgi:hypothetical protein
VIVTVKERVVGAHILAPGAGEMIHELALAIMQRLKLSDVASLAHIYPTLSLGNERPGRRRRGREGQVLPVARAPAMTGHRFQSRDSSPRIATIAPDWESMER